MRVLLLVYDKEYTFFPAVNKEGLDIENMWKERKYQYCFWTKVLRKLHIPISLWGRFFLDKWVKRLDEYQQVIIFDAVYEPMIGKWMKQKNVNGYIYMWDGKNRERLSPKQEFPVLSFNPNDVSLGMIFQSSFYGREILRGIECSGEYDVFYCGRAKKRKEEIKRICSFLMDCGFHEKYHIVTDQTEYWEQITTCTEELTYQDNLRLVAKSKAVLNIVDKKEYGTITPRCLEALYLNKKLITNDSEIAKSDLYHENNVFILRDESALEAQKKEIIEFMARPYAAMPQEILDKYDINYVRFAEQ